MNIRDYQVKTIKLPWYHFLINFLNSFIRMIFCIIFALPGMLMLVPLGLIVAYFAEKERRKALATSTVKVRAVDVMASVKVLASLVLYPIYCTIFSVIFYLYCQNTL